MNIPFFDAHCDTIGMTGNGPIRSNGGQLDLNRLSKFASGGQIFAIYADSANFAPDARFAECRRLYERFARELGRNTDLVMQCRSGGDIRRAFDTNRVAAVLSVEGSELLDCDPEKLAVAEAWGVRAVNLTWNHANAISGSHMDDPLRGLSEQGRAFVREAEKRRILMDVSHLSEPGFWDLAEMSTRPIIASHSNSKAICPNSRNLTDEQFRAIVQLRGFVGINFYTVFVGDKPDMDALIAHIEHFWELGGEDTLGLGGDWDGCDSLAAGLSGVQDMPLVYEALYRRNYGEELLNKLFSENLVRTLD